jgi:ribulose 1,5-bisphosphate synthetase/thiazole synthase
MVSSTIVTLLAAVQLALALPRGVQRAKILARQEDLADSYDYVIIGGGTAGLTVADRLTEDPGVTVLVIENGPSSR